MNSKRKTGLGTAAFFQRSSEEEVVKDGPVKQGEIDQEKPSSPQEAKSEEKGKVRTTVTLYRETLAGMEALKIQERRHGNKATFSDILNEAIQGLMEKKGIEV